jgi:hypothetical protein
VEPKHKLLSALSTTEAADASGPASRFAATSLLIDFWCSANMAFTGDFDGDGDEDLLCHNGAGTTDPWGGYGWFIASDGKTFAAGVGWLEKWCPEATSQFGVGDFDGDHIDDVWCHGGPSDAALRGKTKIALGSGAGFDTTGTWILEDFCSAAGSELAAGDFDGDGKADFLCHGANRAGADATFIGQTWVAINDGAFPTSLRKEWRTDWCTGPNATIGFGDFNGDKMLDGYCHTSTGTTFVYASKTGTFVDGTTLLGGCTGIGSEIGSGVAVQPAYK